MKQVNARYKMNEILNKFLFAGYKFAHEIHLRRPGFTYSTCEPFTKKQKKNPKT